MFVGAIVISMLVVNHDIVPRVDAAIIIVPNDYPTIQEAIDAAQPGDTVFVTSGVYHEDLVISKRITLMGEDKLNTALDGAVFGETVHVDADFVNITGFTIQYSGSLPGESAIELDHVNNCSIFDNNINFNNYFGVFINGSNDNDIVNNIFILNRFGLWLESSRNNRIENNAFNNDSVVIKGDELSHFNSHFIPINNLVNGNPLYYYPDHSGQVLDGKQDNFGQIILANCQDFVLTNLRMDYTDVPIEIAYSSRVNITNGDIYDSKYYGLYIFSSNDIVITNSTLDTYKEGGIKIEESSSIIISANELTCSLTGAEKLTEGLYVDNSMDFTICENFFSNTEIGVLINGSESQNIYNNTFKNDGIIIKGSQLAHFNTHTIPTNNTVNGKPLYFYKDDKDVIIDSTPVGELIVVNSTNFTVSNLVLNNSDVGMELAYSSDISISNNEIFSEYVYGIYLYSAEVKALVNHIYNNNYGIWLESSSLCNINFNNISDNSKGIKLVHSYNSNNIIGNHIISNNNEGLYLDFSSSNLIKDNNISENWYGIHLLDSQENRIESNEIFDNRYAIYDHFSSNTTIKENSLNAKNHGVWLDSSMNIKIYSNNLWEVGVFIEGEELSHFNTHTMPVNNSVNGKPLYYYKNTGGVHIDGISLGELILANCTEFNISNLQMDNVDVAFEMAYSHENNMSEIEITQSQYGMWFWSVWDNTVQHSNVSASDIGISLHKASDNNLLSNINVSNNMLWGVLLSESSFNVIQDCFAFSNMNGIKLLSSNNNTITRNTMGGFGTGVVLDLSSNFNVISINSFQGMMRGMFISLSLRNTIKFNMLSQNTLEGIAITRGSHNTVVGNYISDNGKGISMDSAEFNLIYHNNLLFNAEQAFDNTGTNLWNDSYPSGGNYWFDYAGGDSFRGPDQNIPGSDGIGDTPYSVPDMGQDNYPLMDPFLPDMEPPKIELVSPQNNSYIKSGTIVDLNVTDPNLDEVTFSVNGNQSQSLGPPYDIDTSGWNDGNYLIDIYASDTQGNINTSGYNFTVDSTEPVILLDTPLNNSYVTTGAILDFSVSDAHLDLVEYSINGNPFSPLNDPYDIPTADWTDGNYSLQMDAFDRAGNVNSQWFFFTFDSNAPIIVLNAPANGSLIPGSTVLDFSIIEPNLNHSTYRLNGGPESPLAFPFDISTAGWSDGDYTVTIYAEDKAGLSDSSWFIFTLDSTLPEISLNSPSNNSFIPKETLLDLQVADDNLDSVSYTVNGGPETPLPHPFDISTADWADDEYTVTIEAADTAGNVQTRWYYFTIDSIRPTIVLNIPGNNSCIVGGTVIDFSVSDENLKEVKSSINGGTDEQLPEPFDIDTDTLGDGSISITITAADMAGNENMEYFVFIIDSQPPSISLQSPSENSFLQDDGEIDLSIADDNLDSVSYSINGGAQISLSSPYDIDTGSWASGEYVLSVIASDLAGNVEEEIFSFKKDTEPPEIMLSTPQNNSLVSQGTDLYFEISDDNLDSVEYSLDGITYDALEDPFVVDTTSWVDGTYTIYVRAEDEAGNDVERWYSFLLDESGPFVLSSNPPDASSDIPIDTSIMIEFSESMDTDSVENAISISPFLDYSISWNSDNTELTITFSEPLVYDTEYTVTIGTQAQDMAGRGLDLPLELEFTTEAAPQDSTGGGSFDWLPLLLILIAVIALILLVFFLARRKKPGMQIVEPEGGTPTIFQVRCSNCNNILSVTDTGSAQRVACPFCAAELTVLQQQI
ncbi:MAG: right-handed parallel beta-helix repeat-containing protein [Thermoplasmata archaeon]|nr:MAG: right-handed parallel beta-helix repeat-containing protein [Thermoplasmata archaeon]